MGESTDNLITLIQGLTKNDLFMGILIAAVIVVITGAGSAIVSRLIRSITQVDGLPLPSSSILVNIARIVIWAIGLSIMLSSCFNVDVNGLIAALGIGGLAVSLGLQDTIKNFIGGLQVTFMRIVNPGDYVIVGSIEGIVQDVTWRQTVVKDHENKVHLIPNAIINSTTVTRIEPSCLVVSTVVLNTDGRDIDEVLREMELRATRAVRKVARLEKDPWLLVTQIGEYGIWAKMRFVLEDVTNAREARDAALRAIAPFTRNNAIDILPDDGSED